MIVVLAPEFGPGIMNVNIFFQTAINKWNTWLFLYFECFAKFLEGMI
jgi:hypothetical protein